MGSWQPKRPLYGGRPCVLLCDQIVQNVAGDVGQAEIPAAITLGQLGVLNPEELEDGGVNIVHVDGFLDRLKAEIFGSAVDLAALHVAAGEPNGDAERMLIAASLHP